MKTIRVNSKTKESIIMLLISLVVLCMGIAIVVFVSLVPVQITGFGIMFIGSVFIAKSVRSFFPEKEQVVESAKPKPDQLATDQNGNQIEIYYE